MPREAAAQDRGEVPRVGGSAGPEVQEHRPEALEGGTAGEGLSSREGRMVPAATPSRSQPSASTHAHAEALTAEQENRGVAQPRTGCPVLRTVLSCSSVR